MELVERMKYCVFCFKQDAELRSAEETSGTGLVSKVYAGNKVNNKVIYTFSLARLLAILCWLWCLFVASLYSCNIHCMTANTCFFG